MALKPASTFIPSRSPIVDGDGNATFVFNKILQGWQTQLQNGLSQIGQIAQPIPPTIPIQGRTEGIGTTIQNIDSGGVVAAAGIDFARAYINKNTDHIADGTGSPLAGGKAAEIALVTSAPAPTPSRFLTGLVAGIFQKAQVAFSDLFGTATAAQIPPLSALSGQITIAQGPAAGITHTVPLAKLTGLGSNGSVTYQNGIAIAAVDPT